MVDSSIHKGERHILLATDQQLSMLSRSRQWFVDGTFKIVRAPFYQLLSVHAFVRSGQDAKMLPLAFVIMSRRRTSDYVKVFRRLLAILPREPEVKTVILDFELATWKALAKVLPAVRLRGCLFHLTQAVWRKCQEFGLQIAYQKDDAVHKFVRKLMALPFLPSEYIPRMFAKIADRVERHGPLNQLIIYFRRQWMEHQVFEPSTWSAYRVTIRTNNHVEGWHRQMNGKVGEQALGIYRLIPELHREAALLQIQTRLILEGRLRSYLRKAATARQEEIFAVWRMYKRTDLTLSQLLSRCAMIHGPVIQ